MFDSSVLLGCKSPESTEKESEQLRRRTPHHILKCGTICTVCRVVCRSEAGFKSIECMNGTTNHKIVTAGYMCQNCPCLSSDATAFRQEHCDMAFCLWSYSNEEKPLADPSQPLKGPTPTVPVFPKEKPGLSGRSPKSSPTPSAPAKDLSKQSVASPIPKPTEAAARKENPEPSAGATGAPQTKQTPRPSQALVFRKPTPQAPRTPEPRREMLSSPSVTKAEAKPPSRHA